MYTWAGMKVFESEALLGEQDYYSTGRIQWKA